MASHIVVVEGLEAAFVKMIDVVSAHCGEPTRSENGSGVVVISWSRPYVPAGADPEYVAFRNARKPRENPYFKYKQGLFESLQGAPWDRIRWFYYCDNALGNTIRLYDTEHFEHELNRELYLELEGNGQWLGKNQSFPDRVLIRGEHLERESKPLKRAEFRRCFSKRFSARNAPPGDQQAEVNLEGMCEEFFNKRHAYFQHRSQNNMPGEPLHVTCDKRCKREPCNRLGRVPAISSTPESGGGESSDLLRQPHHEDPHQRQSGVTQKTPTSHGGSLMSNPEGHQQKIKLHGYSERGMINAICEDILYADHPLDRLESFLSWCRFPFQPEELPDFSEIQDATLLVEQSFSEFGDLDLLILTDHRDGRKQSVLLEAKVATDTSTPRRIRDQWQDLHSYLAGSKDKRSSLFIQIYRKLRLIRQVGDLGTLLEPDSVAERWSLGSNRVVRKAAELLAKYRENPWYVVLVPDEETEVERFFDSELRNFISTNYNLPDWDVSRLGYLTWPDVEKRCKADDARWRRTLENFDWNREQIYPFGTRTSGEPARTVSSGNVYRHRGRLVLVVNMGSTNCRVVPLAIEGGYYPTSERVQIASLEALEEPPPTPELRLLQPARGRIYTWQPPKGHVYQPGNRPPVPQPPKRVKVVTPGWETTAVVEVADDGSPFGDRFWVFNHHLKRS